MPDDDASMHYSGIVNHCQIECHATTFTHCNASYRRRYAVHLHRRDLNTFESFDDFIRQTSGIECFFSFKSSQMNYVEENIVHVFAQHVKFRIRLKIEGFFNTYAIGI
ncbi:unnamed protein product [Xylocopa violacea]|uniref:Uncharacterized protein n=1 Tax=Xylocopa violacea TaxID=135666 RepID=A0ABP1NBI6_XYLVO